jgi:hypothetical protein
MAMRPRYYLALIDQSLRIERLRSPWIEGGTRRYSIAEFRIRMPIANPWETLS